MGLFTKIANVLNEVAEESARNKREKDRQEQELLTDYRSREIYVLAVYVNGSLWNYFYYPSEEYRQEAAKNFWPPFFSKQGLSWNCQFIDPR